MERIESEGVNPNVGSESINPNVGSDQTSFDRSVSGRVKSVASTVKQKASTIPALLADGLEAGAQALRQNRAVVTETAAAGSSVAVSKDSNVAAVTDTLASGMQSSADWLRDADLDKIKDGVEKQVKEHPARSLLVALGAGYLIGKAFRR
jgi:hypothetical protein